MVDGEAEKRRSRPTYGRCHSGNGPTSDIAEIDCIRGPIPRPSHVDDALTRSAMLVFMDDQATEIRRLLAELRDVEQREAGLRRRISRLLVSQMYAPYGEPVEPNRVRRVRIGAGRESPMDSLERARSEVLARAGGMVSVEQAAALLDVPTAVVQERIANGTLLFLPTPSGPELPRAQFGAHGGTIAGLEESPARNKSTAHG